jgi:hypothetical protein
MLAAMVRTVWLYENRPELNRSGALLIIPVAPATCGRPRCPTTRSCKRLERHPTLREYVGVGEWPARRPTWSPRRTGAPT